MLQPPHRGLESDAEARASLVGKGPGFVVVTEGCHKEYAGLKAKGVEFIDAPMEMPWGVSAVFVDLYGYAHNLLEPRMG